MTSSPQLVALARKTAAVQSLDATLVCAVIEQASSWNSWAMRYEPAFFAKYVAHLNDEKTRPPRKPRSETPLSGPPKGEVPCAE